MRSYLFSLPLESAIRSCAESTTCCSFVKISYCRLLLIVVGCANEEILEEVLLTVQMTKWIMGPAAGRAHPWVIDAGDALLRPIQH